jgi:hypothetical protein
MVKRQRQQRKPIPPMPLVGAAPQEERVSKGVKFLALIWSEIAAKVVEEAVRVYELSPDQAAAVREAFLRRVQYDVEAC